MGVRSDHHKWTPEDLRFIKNTAGTLTDQQLARHFNVSLTSAKRARQRLGLKKAQGRGLNKIISTNNGDKQVSNNAKSRILSAEVVMEATAELKEEVQEELNIADPSPCCNSPSSCNSHQPDQQAK